jgi:uncharacterized RDD family membrane protein YckC
VAIDGGVSAPRRAATAAPLTRRFVAWILDSAIVLIPAALALTIARHHGPGLDVALLVVAAIVLAVINQLALVVRTGQSVGRRLFDIRVVDSTAMIPPRVGQVLWRNFIGGANVGILWHPIAALPNVALGPWPLICYGFAVADGRWHRAVNDRWSHTVVIDVRQERVLATSGPGVR